MTSRSFKDSVSTENESLLNALHESAVEVSYFRAAEDDWGRETQERERAEKRWDALKEEAKVRGIWEPKLYTRFMVDRT